MHASTPWAEYVLTSTQEVEQTALQLWDLGNALYDPLRGSTGHWRLPKCYRRDSGPESSLGLTGDATDASVLLMEDLGDVQDIMSHIQNNAAAPHLPPNLEAQILAAGEILGISLARLHSQYNLSRIANYFSTQAIFSQSLTNHLVWGAMLDSLPEYLSTFADGKELFLRVEEDFKFPKYSYPRVLSHGDFHTGNVLMPSPNSGSVIPIVIDWEFAHLGRGINDDASKFTASIHCILIDARRDGCGASLVTLLRRLISGFCSGYRTTAQQRWDAKNAEDKNLLLLRSAMLFHGTEMIVFASEFMSESLALQEMLSIGVWYLRNACADAEAFASQDLAKLALEEDESIINSLFSNEIC
ncbi:hypothetical protein NLG97_g932 [Lecanicillium saksenae]|uniref:Uncharacterized protein n=1 Tax=Lecanicillium saksenae TaxID=468837 RepID=A0ACC1R744_9HYPO|nr:hypothetical protein NLG97_g932 [Lecanicillium saksenae]